jgi:DNA repair exonuclease SbcCD ATPase subunit
MAVFNKILNVLIFVLAIAAVVFGFMLFQKREELKDRGDQMAKVIHSVAETLDDNNNSGTDAASKLLLSKSAPSSVSLYHDNFKKLGTVLKTFETQAADIIAQRNALSKTLFKVAKTLDLPNADSFAAIQFQNIEKYAKKDSDLISLLGKVEKRDSDIAAKLVSIASQVDCTIDPNTLKSLDGYSAPLADFSGKIKAVKEKTETLASHIKTVCSTWGVSEPALDGDDYADSLGTVESSLKSKKDEFEQTKTELSNTKEQLADVNDKLTQKLEIIKSKDNKIAKMQKKIDFLGGGGEDTESNTPQIPQTNQDLVNMLEGKVLRVNKKWGFVMIDLGKDNKMVIGNKKKVEKSVALPEGKIMTVARNDKYIGQIKVVKVNNDCSIADMLCEPGGDAIQPGDKVYFSRKLAAPKKADDEDEADDDDAADNADKADDNADKADDSDDSSDDDELDE